LFEGHIGRADTALPHQSTISLDDPIFAAVPYDGRRASNR